MPDEEDDVIGVAGGCFADPTLPSPGRNDTVLISSGQVQQERARRLESVALLAMKRFNAGEMKVVEVLDALEQYEECYDPTGGSHREQYTMMLDARPWKSCECDVCTTLGHHVILFRGAERNRRRGLHNTWTF